MSKRYDGAATPALDELSLDIEPGETVAVMGRSGSGKSTLLNLIAGLDVPTGGTVTVDGVRLTGLGEGRLAKFRRTRVGIVFQFFNLVEDLTALDNVLLPAQLAGASYRACRDRAQHLLGTLGVAERAASHPARLSGGERQRVAIARALMNRPALLLADEPTGALDTESGRQVIDLLADLNRSGLTLVLVTHDLSVARQCATRVVSIRDGRLEDPAGPTGVLPR